MTLSPEKIAGKTQRSDIERFNERYFPEPMSGCWLWDSEGHKFGYGQFTINNRHEGAHRASWMLHRGPIPKGQMVLHRCDNPACVNPDHLFLGDARTNAMDCLKKGRGPARLVLTAELVKQVRDRRAAGESWHDISRDTGIKVNTLHLAGSGKSWAHVGGHAAPSRTRRMLTPEEVQQILNDPRTNCSEIGRSMGRASQTVSGIRHRYGWVARSTLAENSHG